MNQDGSSPVRRRLPNLGLAGLALAATAATCVSIAYASIAGTSGADDRALPVASTRWTLPGSTQEGEAETAIRIWYPVLASASRETSSRLPLLLYLHGWTGQGGNLDPLLATLAARGFVALDVGTEPANQDPLDFSTEAASLRSRAAADRLVAARARHALAVLDRFERAHARILPAPVAASLDTARVGIVGSSFGGGVAVEAARRDHRVRAVLNLDGWVFGDAARAGSRAAYMLVTDSFEASTPADLADPDPSRRCLARQMDRDLALQERELAASGGYVVEIAGATHGSLSAGPSPWWSRLRSLRLGPAAAPPVFDTVTRYATAFFDSELRGVSSELLEKAQGQRDGLRLLVWRAGSSDRTPRRACERSGRDRSGQ